MHQALENLQSLGVKPREILREVERKHIFTHIQWNMRGIYLEVMKKTGDFRWFRSEEVNRSAALPTAFRQFWEERDYV